MDFSRSMKKAAFLAAHFLLFLPSFLLSVSPAEAQSIGGACPTAGNLALIGNSSPGELLYCNGWTWGLAEAITSGGLIGIGTTSPSELLHVNGNGLVGGALSAAFFGGEVFRVTGSGGSTIFSTVQNTSSGNP